MVCPVAGYFSNLQKTQIDHRLQQSKQQSKQKTKQEINGIINNNETIFQIYRDSAVTAGSMSFCSDGAD
jgi:ferritin-like metal-binding protein YciE